MGFVTGKTRDVLLTHVEDMPIRGSRGIKPAGFLLKKSGKKISICIETVANETQVFPCTGPTVALCLVWSLQNIWELGTMGASKSRIIGTMAITAINGAK